MEDSRLGMRFASVPPRMSDCSSSSAALESCVSLAAIDVLREDDPFVHFAESRLVARVIRDGASRRPTSQFRPDCPHRSHVGDVCLVRHRLVSLDPYHKGEQKDKGTWKGVVFVNERGGRWRALDAHLVRRYSFIYSETLLPHELFSRASKKPRDSSDRAAPPAP